MLGLNAWSTKDLIFPYPPLMAVIIYIPIIIGEIIKFIYLKNLFFHLPLLLADIILYLFLSRLNTNKQKEILFYYVLSPVIFYSTYIHSQLDIIPTCFVFASSYFLTKNRTTLSYALLGLAVTAKIHTIVALPFFLIYSYRRRFLSIKNLVFLLPIIFAATPFYINGKMSSLFRAHEISLLFESYIQIVDLKLYIFPMIYVGLVAAAISVKRYNTEIFLGILTIVFMTFVIAIYPNPGWFTWSIPFLTYSFIKNNKKQQSNILIYLLISFSYLIFFLFFYSHPFSPTSNFIFLNKNIDLLINEELIRNISLTLLVSISLYGIYSVFQSAISNSILYKRKFNAFVIGIAGDSGAGKSTLLESLSQILGNKMVTQLEGDGEHKWARGDQQWSQLTHLNPKANHLHLQMSHIIRLKQGLSTKRRDYNHKTGSFELHKEIKPNDFIVIAGLHPYFLKGARKHFDFKIYIETQDELRKKWKISRDVALRGKSPDESQEDIEQRTEDSKKYITPQKDFADLIIKYGFKENVNEVLTVSYEVDADIYLDNLISDLQFRGLDIKEHSYSEDLTKQIISVDSFQNINFKVFQIRYQEIIDLCGISEPKWQDGIFGLNQLILFHCINEKYISYEINND